MKCSSGSAEGDGWSYAVAEGQSVDENELQISALPTLGVMKQLRTGNMHMVLQSCSSKHILHVGLLFEAKCNSPWERVRVCGVKQICIWFLKQLHLITYLKAVCLYNYRTLEKLKHSPSDCLKADKLRTVCILNLHNSYNTKWYNKKQLNCNCNCLDLGCILNVWNDI